MSLLKKAESAMQLKSEAQLEGEAFAEKIFNTFPPDKAMEAFKAAQKHFVARYAKKSEEFHILP